MKKGQKMDRTPHCITVWGMFGTSLCQLPITDKPHDPAGLDVNPDYSDFMGRSVVYTYLDANFP